MEVCNDVLKPDEELRKEDELLRAAAVNSEGLTDGETQSSEGTTKPLSKREAKKLKKKIKFEERKAALRLKDKERQKRKNQKMLEETGLTVKARRKFLAEAKERCVNINVIFDLSFADLMSELDRAKVVKQIGRCYSVNRASEAPLKIHLTGLDGTMLDAMRAGQPGFPHWQIHTQSPQGLSHTFFQQIEKKKLCYLTAESDTVLEKLEEDQYYIIGALVDHNSHKGHCHRIATQELQLPTARLPITEHISLSTRHVLAVNHVFEILLEFTRLKSWPDALVSVIPQRKGAQIVELKEGEASSESAEDNEFKEYPQKSEPTGENE